MSISPQRGEVWFADLGVVGKGRPVLVLYYPDFDDARALAVVAPLTSQIRQMRGEVYLGRPRWLPKVFAVNVQGLASLDRHKLTRKYGMFEEQKYEEVKIAIRELLAL